MVNSCCCVPNCSDRGGHEFPKDLEHRKQYVVIVAIKREDNRVKGKLWTPTRNKKPPLTCEAGVQTDSSPPKPIPEEPKFIINQFVKDASGLKFYTGCENIQVFYSILHSLGPAAYELNYWQDVKPKISILDQLPLTLMKIRTYKVNFELARFFSICMNMMFTQSLQPG